MTGPTKLLKITPLIMTGVGLVTAAAMVAALPAINAGHGLAAAPAPVASDVALVSNSHGWEDDDWEDDDWEGEHWSGHGGGGLSGLGGVITSFLAANQEAVVGFTAGVPTFYLGPVAVGRGVLADAYYNGYLESAVGVPGLVAYVTSQLQVPPSDTAKGIVLGVTGLVPKFNLGPVQVGGSLLATAYYDGYSGSAAGFPGLISYVTSQLGLQPAASLAAVGPSASRTAAVAAPRAAASTVMLGVDAPKAAASTRRAAVTPKATATARSAAAAPKAGAAKAGAAASTGHRR
jgi:hypothetical protein